MPGDYEFQLGKTFDDRFPSVSKVDIKNLAANTTVKVNVIPIQDLSSADIPAPPEDTDEAVQALLMELEVDGEESSEHQATVHFELSESQIGQSDYDSVTMWRWSDAEWQRLRTTYLGLEDQRHGFQAETPGFSLFLITKKVVTEEIATTEPYPTAEPVPRPTPARTPEPTTAPSPTATPIPPKVELIKPTPQTGGTPVPEGLPTPPLPDQTIIPSTYITIQAPGTIDMKAGEVLILNDVQINTSDGSSDYSVEINWGDRTPPTKIQTDDAKAADGLYSNATTIQMSVTARS